MNSPFPSLYVQANEAAAAKAEGARVRTAAAAVLLSEIDELLGD